MLWITLLCGALLGTDDGNVPILDRPVPPRAIGGELQAALDEPFAAAWEAIPLRTLLRAIAGHRHVALLLDRRLDPTQPVTFRAAEGSLWAALQGIAAAVGAEARRVGNVVCIGPPDSVSKLRTLVALREQELLTRRRGLPVARQRQLTDEQTVHWNDLDRPADILRQIGEQFALRIDGLDAVPHDLWAAATLPAVRADEALTLVLGQFDLTFEWTDTADGVRIVPMPERVELEKSYHPRGMTATVAAGRWPQEFPGLTATAHGSEVVVRGTAEQHEALEELLHPHPKPKPTPTAGAATLARHLPSTARVQDVPAAALLKRLEETGVRFEYDPAALKAAGVDLTRRMALDVKDATPDEFLQALCKPLGLKYEVDGLTVRLAPR